LIPTISIWSLRRAARVTTRPMRPKPLMAMRIGCDMGWV